MKETDVIRARFLMSPYNLREARRVREIRNVVVGIGLTIAVLAGVAAFMSLFYR